MRRRRLLTAGTILGLAGCVSVPQASSPSSDQLLQEALETRRTLSTLETRRRMVMETPTETTERLDRLIQRPPGEQRLDVLESDDPDVVPGAVSVRSRTLTSEYNPETNIVTERHHPNRLVIDRMRQVLESVRTEYDLSYAGLETVDGRETHRIDAHPDDDTIDGRSIDLLIGETVYRIPFDGFSSEELADATVERSVWIDDEHRYPIRERDTVSSEDGILHRVTVTSEDLTIDGGLEQGTFRYDPPAEAEVVTIGTEPEGVYETRSEAAAVVPYDLPDPSMPDPFVLDRVTVVEHPDGYRTTLWYTDPDAAGRELFLAVRETQRFNPSALEQTTLEFDGQPVYRRDGRIESLFWTCDGLSFELSSPTADLELETVATSVGCS
ncbi:LolA family protein [Natronolimnobius baerhuensis]|uniref:DUF2092 domain-containing protein n=1 Tax=Natronolimnobius baerhuensis TaxID=253108 RepID=A0A202ECW6_9EURY|nr:DUF2092 domain-containing protein [Natronolimnobius baerhuensis]OVE86116.1 DUF2092 domain-containing protein [Natronolimnobius baerhuensis]